MSKKTTKIEDNIQVVEVDKKNTLENVFTPSPLPSSSTSEDIGKYSRTTYVFNGDTYRYLDDDLLQTNFERVLGNRNTATFSIKLFLYKIVDECKEPFLQFLVEEENETMVFPHFNLFAGEIANKLEMNTLFQKRCMDKFRELSGVSEEIAKRTYRGFLEENENTIFVMFDCTYVNVDVNMKRFWGILDEIVNEKRIYNVPVEKDIYNMVQNHEHVAYIKDKNGQRINMPCCLYLCKINETGEYENVYYPNAEHDMKQKSPVDGKIPHDTFGFFYYFTTDPIHKYDNIRSIKRYSVFIDNSLYVLNINKSIDEIDFASDNEETSFDEDVKSYKDYTCIYFFEDGIQVWCVKNISRFVEL
jgi:L-rhamnose mutarotase